MMIEELLVLFSCNTPSLASTSTFLQWNFIPESNRLVNNDRQMVPEYSRAWLRSNMRFQNGTTVIVKRFKKSFVSSVCRLIIFFFFFFFFLYLRLSLNHKVLYIFF